MFNDDELNEQELAALAALPREMAPSDLLEERVVRALRSEGHFGAAPQPRRAWAKTSLRIAAAAALFIGGVATGRYALTQPAERAATSSSIVAPATRNAATFDTNTSTKPVKNSETVVAEREMWL
jgi:hypothetical protein